MSTALSRLRYLCACFTDLDYYKVGLGYGHTIGTLVEYQDRGFIPPISVIIRSGRGLWLVWLQHDRSNPDVAPRAWPEKVRLYARVQSEINHRLTHLGADAQDALRITRVPGSTHSQTGQRVKYWVQADETGHSFSYTIDELAECFGVSHERPIRLGLATPASLPSGRANGPKALTEYRFNDFMALLRMRDGGFDRGCRNHAAMYYAWLLKCKKVPKDEAVREVTNMGRACRPPLSNAECRDAVISGYNPSWTSNIGNTTGNLAPPSIRYQTLSD